MGIRGLSSYFSNRESFFQTVSLENTEIIIDGNNLRYSLYRDCPGTHHAFAGEYDKYYRFVLDYFQTMQKCGVRPLVVLDGGYDVSEIKLRTVLMRAKDQIRSCVSCTPVNQHKVQVYPLLGKDVFLEVLSDLGIECLQTEFEADQIIAEMGMARNCPVLSNDSDFFVFTVDFVRLDSIDIHRSKSEGKLICEVFNRGKFLEHYGLANSELLHLLASLIGNDYIPPSVFDVVFSNIKLPKKTASGSERHRRIRGLISWLARETSVNTALDRILGCFQEKERKNLKEKVLASMRVYSGKGESLSIEHALLPDWARTDYRECRLPNWIMDIVARKKFLLPSQVECGDRPSAHLHCLPLMETIVSLLSTTEEPVTVQGRVKYTVGNLAAIQTTPVPISELTLVERLKLLLDSLNSRFRGGQEKEDWFRSGLDPEDWSRSGKEQEDRSRCGGGPPGLPQELGGLFLVLEYWSRLEAVTPAHIFAVLLYRSIALEIDPCTHFQRSEKKLKLELGRPGTTGTQAVYLASMLQYVHLFHVEEGLKTSPRRYDRGLVHGLAVLQSVFYHVSVLNTLLGGVLTLPGIQQFYSGTFLYNAIVHFTKRPENMQDCHLPAAEKTKFWNTLNFFLSNLTHLKPLDAKKAKTKKKKARGNPEFSDNVESEIEQEEGFFDVENRFSVLKVS